MLLLDLLALHQVSVRLMRPCVRSLHFNLLRVIFRQAHVQEGIEAGPEAALLLRILRLGKN